MSNMSYCRFQNTANDLADCAEHLFDKRVDGEEARARLRILDIAIDMLSDLGIDVDLGDASLVDRINESMSDLPDEV